MRKLFLIPLLAFCICYNIHSQCNDIVLSTQTEVSNFSCSEILGNLIISDDNDGIDDIITLLPLRTSGLLVIRKSLIIRKCNRLKSLRGLDQIERIQSRLSITENDSLLTINDDTIQFTLSKIGFDLIIRKNAQLLTINGFEGVDTINVAVEIINNDTLSFIAGFDGLSTVNKLIIKNNSAYQGQIGFRTLEEISDSIIVTGNPSLNSCCWLADLSNLAPDGATILSNNGEGCSDIDNLQSPAPDLSNCPDSERIFNLPGLCIGEFTIQIPNLNDRCNLETFSLSVFSNDGIMTHQLEIDDEVEEVFLEEIELGLNTIVFLAADSDGKSDTCTLSLEVVDTEFPSFQSEFADDTLLLIGNSCLARYSIVFPDIEDNCTSLSSELYIVNTANEDTVYSTVAIPGINYNIDLTPGNYKVVAFVSDEFSLTDISSALIFVPNENTPILSPCPDDVTVETNDDCLATYEYLVPMVEGACTNYHILREIINTNGSIIGGGIVMQGISRIDTFPIGENELIFRIIDATGENTSCIVNVMVNGADDPVILLSADTLDCSNAGVVINTDFDTSGISFSWSGPNNFNSSELEPMVFDPGIYTLTIESSATCIFEESVEVLQGFSVVEIEAIKGAINCDEGSRKISLSEDFDDYRYVWTGPDSFMSVVEAPFVSLAGWYFVTIESTFGCIGSDSILIDTDISYTFEILQNGDQAKIIIEGGTGPFNYLWDSSETGDSIENLTNGSHTLKIVDGLGCIRNISFQVDVSSTLEENEVVTVITPNPFTEQIQIKNAEGLTVQLFDLNGRTMFINTKNHEIINVSHLSKGLYFLYLSNGDVHKIIK